MNEGITRIEMPESIATNVGLLPSERAVQIYEHRTKGIAEGIHEMLTLCAKVQRIPDDDNICYSGVTALCVQLKEATKALEQERKAITVQLDEVKKAVMAKEKLMASPLLDEHARLTKLATDYIRLQQEKAEAARRAREEEEAQIASMMEDAEAAGIPLVMPPVSASNVPPVSEPKSTATNTQEYYDFEIVDPVQVPRDFCIPENMLIRNYLNSQKKLGMKVEQITIPGVRVFKAYRLVKRR